MDTTRLAEKAKTYLHHLCLEIPNRRVGSIGNREAVNFFTEKLAAFQFRTRTSAFECMDWSQEGALLAVGSAAFQAYPSPYTNSCRVSAPLEICSTVKELEGLSPGNSVLLLRGEIAKEQIMPKNFPFYNPEEHQHIIRLLEEKHPLAIITATERNPQMAGALYPFPLLEDGDFDIPSVYLTEEEGDRLAESAGREVSLEIRARRIPSQGCNSSGEKGSDPSRRVVLMAHIDAKYGSPGAIDNASGITTLLLLAELLAEYSGQMTIEITAINGEDYYSTPGEQLFLKEKTGHFEEILLGINLDGAGYLQGKTAYSIYECPQQISEIIRNTFSTDPDFMEGDPWYQGDHGLFIMNGRPALAVTSEQVYDIMANYVHTKDDCPAIIDPGKLASLALALRNLLLRLDENS